MPNCIWFDDSEGKLIEYTGGKGASLSKMHQAQLPVPNGFVISAPFFKEYLAKTGLIDKIIAMIEAINYDDFSEIENVSAEIRKMIVDEPFPEAIVEDIAFHYINLEEGSPAVAVRSSGTAEDLDDASFAGQQETYLYVVGLDDVIEKIKECWASLYNGRAIFYRCEKGFSEKEVSIAVVIQKMVNSEKAGVMFSVNPISKDPNMCLVEAAWGLGEGVVSGIVTPDNYVIDKSNDIEAETYISEKETMVVRDPSMRGSVEQDVPADLKEARVLSVEEIEELSKMSKHIEKFFGKPQDIEWAIEKNTLYLLQSRPITTL